MHVNRIDTSVNFGYDKKLNAIVEQKLKSYKRNKDFYQTLYDFNKLANNIERRIRKAEKNGNALMVARLVSSFYLVKSFVSASIEYCFPKLDYCITEAMSYTDERDKKGISNPDHWLNRTAVELIENYQECENYRNGISTQDAEQQMQAVSTQNFGVNKKGEQEEEGDISDILTEYKPTEEAKKGFAALGGMAELKETLNERIVTMLKNPEQARIDAEEYGKKMPSGILFYGPPGCGKTTVVEHLSTEAKVPLYKIEAGKIGGIYIHETSQNIEEAFDYAEAQATPEKPVLMLIDDADALFSARDGYTADHHSEELSSFLNRIQKARDKNVIVIAATNRYDNMDEAVRSRFEEQIYVGLPDKPARESIVKMFLNKRTKGKSLAENGEAISEIADKFDGFPIRAIKMIADKASIAALKDGRRDITADDFNKIISESQNMKVKEQNYESNANRPSIGFGS